MGVGQGGARLAVSHVASLRAGSLPGRRTACFRSGRYPSVTAARPLHVQGATVKTAVSLRTQMWSLQTRTAKFAPLSAGTVGAVW